MALTKQKLLHKRSSVVGRILPTSALTYGEIAVNFSSGANNSFLETKKYDDTPGLFFIYPYGTNALTANGVEDGYFSASTSGLTSYFDGLTVKVKLNGHTYNENWNTLNINGIGPKLIWYRYNQPATIQYPINSEVTLTYRTDAGSYVATANERGLISGQTYTDGWVAQFVPDNGIDAIISGINYTIKQDEFVISAALNDLNDRKQDLTERVTTINSTSTDDEYPTAKAVYDIVNGSVATNVDYKGATSVIPATSQAGDMYIAANAIALTAAQSATGAAATAETGDFLIARSSGKWDIIQKNLDGAVTTTAVTLTDGNVLVGGGNHTAKVSSYTIGKSVPSTALFTDSATTETGHYTPGTTASTLGSTTAGNFLQTVILDSKKHVISATTATALTSYTEASLSVANSGSTNTAAQSVVYGITTGGTKGHSLTLQRTNKIYSASTADSASFATNLSGPLHIYQNGSRIATYSGGTISALTTDNLVQQTVSTTDNYRPILLSANYGSNYSGNTTSTTSTAYMSNLLNVQPSTGKIYAGGFARLGTPATNLLTADGNSIAQSTFLTADTSPSISVTNNGNGVVTGGTTGGTKGHSITLNKTTAVLVNSASTAHINEITQSYRTTGTIRGVHNVTIPGVTALTDGMSFKIQLGVDYNGSWNSLKVNNLAAAPLWYSYGGLLTSHYRINNEITVTYRTTATGSALVPSNSSSGLTSGVSYTNGFLIDANYVDGNDTARLVPYYARYYTDEWGINAYCLCGLDKNGKITPLVLSGGTGASKPVNTKGFRPDQIYCHYNGSRTAANTVISHTRIWEAGELSSTVAQYTFNAAPPEYVDIYLKGTLGASDGLFYLSTGVTDFYRFVPANTNSVTLSSYFTSGFYYIRVGRSYSSANYMYLSAINPLFYFDGTNLVEVSPLAKNAITAVNATSATTSKSATTATSSVSATTSKSATTAASSVSATTSKSATTSTSASTASSSVSATTSKSATTASSSVSATTSKSATTSTSASTSASAAKTANSLKIYKNGTLQVTFDGSSSLSALTTDTATTYNGHFTPTGSSTTSGARVTGITIDGKGHVTSIATAATDNVDTKVTDANGNGKAFLLGHATQASNATAVSNANVYMSAGTVSMTELKLAEKAKMVYNTTNNCIDFVFI